MGHIDKIFHKVNHKPIIFWTISKFINHPKIDSITVTVEKSKIIKLNKLIEKWCFSEKIRVIAGGSSRQSSVAIALVEVNKFANKSDTVLVHDGARPLISSAEINAIINSISSKNVSILAVPINDTIKKSRNLHVSETVERNNLWLAQTPQGATLRNLNIAMEFVQKNDSDYPDESSIFEAMNFPIIITPGDPTNIKITTSKDLKFIEKNL